MGTRKVVTLLKCGARVTVVSPELTDELHKLATTGGASRLAGIWEGQVDQVTWVTMTDKGPTIANLALDGIAGDNP